MKKNSYDFSGWATKNDIKCSDGRTIRHNAFKDNDGSTVPLVWNHRHNEPYNVLGHALLENRDNGVYAYCSFNDTEEGKQAKELVRHGDIKSLSIFANKLQQMGGDVVHGCIREVSLVLAGANPGAFIDSVNLAHGDMLDDDEAVIYTDEYISLSHSEEDDRDQDDDSAVDADVDDSDSNEDAGEEDPAGKDDDMNDENNMMHGDDETVEDVFNTLSEKQQTAVYAVIAAALEGDDDEGDNDMKHNLFDADEFEEENCLSHAEMEEIISDGKRYGSLKESFLAHAGEYGIDDIEYLFPDARNVENQPGFIKREDSWVTKVMNSTHHTPFSRIKTIFADITEDEARAKGYIKGNEKKEEVFGLLKRETTPTTIYKKQKLDRDDVIDITDFDVIAWLKGEMRGMLDEEIARAILIGDGRTAADNDKISELNIRPIYSDANLYSIKQNVVVAANASDEAKAKAFIKASVKSRKNYKGSGNPVLFCTEDVLTDMLLIEDSTGRIIYDSVDKLKSALRVSDIVTVPVMENITRTEDNKTLTLGGIIVNLSDYNVGADKGGAISMFDDFDIDFNQQKYLIETRCSGALIKPFSAIVLEFTTAS